MSNVVGAYHLANNPKKYEPARGNTFMFVVSNLDNLLKPGDTDNYIQNAQETLQYSVVSCDIPSFSQEPIVIRRGNSVMKAAGLPEFSNGSNLVINDYVGSDGKSILYSWQQLSYDVKNETVGYMDEYKKDCWLIEYDTKFTKVIRQWILYGCWVSSVTQEAYSYEQGDKRTVSATIQYDHAEMQLSDDE